MQHNLVPGSHVIVPQQLWLGFEQSSPNTEHIWQLPVTPQNPSQQPTAASTLHRSPRSMQVARHAPLISASGPASTGMQA
jgi:hypothetical protein